MAKRIVFSCVWLQENMLSSVSIICLDMSAGMWVISRVFILGCMSRSFISVSLIQRSFFFLFDFSHFVCVLFLRLFCRCFQLFNVDRPYGQAVPQGDDVLFSPAESLPGVAMGSRAPSISLKYSSTYNDGSLGRVIMTWQLFPHLRFTLVFICHMWCLRRRQRQLLEFAVHSIAWMHLLGWCSIYQVNICTIVSFFCVKSIVLLCKG